jgi:hypothetical protein
MKLLGFYVALVFIPSLLAGFPGLGKTFAGVIIISTFMLSIPALIAYPQQKSTLELISDTYCNAILLFHALFLSNLVVLGVLRAASGWGWWSQASSGYLYLAVSCSMMIGLSLQLAVTVNHKVPWIIVPLIASACACTLFYFLTHPY